ncbi:MAG TPA: OstA-like protein [Bacteroidales bacterium]|nr:OstA-like protein [Bacteroidales bacterium]
MAEIVRKKWNSLMPAARFLLVAAGLIIFADFFSSSQETPKKHRKKVHLIYADSYEPVSNLGKDVVKVVGHVAFSQDQSVMTCDSAYFFQKASQLKAFSRVHIQQGDTLNLYGNYLFYDDNDQKADIEGNVELIDKETHLATKSITYDVAQKIAWYNETGTITNGKNKLKSRRGIYNVTDALFHFKDSIIITNPEYVMTADTMDYNTKTETVFFFGPSEVKGDSLYIYCEKGWYDTKNDVSRLWKKSLINNRQQILKGDSLYYEKKNGFGEAFGNIMISDTTNNIMIGGDYARYHKTPEDFFVTRRAVFIQVSDSDSLYLHSDTITAVTVKIDSAKPFRLVRAYFGCRIFSKELQSKCDSISYSFQDSIIRLYRRPVIWSGENQLTSDSMSILIKNKKTDRLELYSRAFIASKVDSIRYNQIKGRNLTGFFNENKLYRIIVKGNGESVYYLEDKDKLIGVTHNQSSSIDIKVDNGKVQQITEIDNPDGKLDPPFLSPAEKMKLPGFTWQEKIRPSKYSDIFLRPVEEPEKKNNLQPEVRSGQQADK